MLANTKRRQQVVLAEASGASAAQELDHGLRNRQDVSAWVNSTRWQSAAPSARSSTSCQGRKQGYHTQPTLRPGGHFYDGLLHRAECPHVVGPGGRRKDDALWMLCGGWHKRRYVSRGSLSKQASELRNGSFRPLHLGEQEALWLGRRGLRARQLSLEERVKRRRVGRDTGPRVGRRRRHVVGKVDVLTSTWPRHLASSDCRGIKPWGPPVLRRSSSARADAGASPSRCPARSVPSIPWSSRHGIARRPSLRHK